MKPVKGIQYVYRRNIQIVDWTMAIITISLLVGTGLIGKALIMSIPQWINFLGIIGG